MDCTAGLGRRHTPGECAALSRCGCQGYGVPSGMSRIHPECSESDPSNRSVAADVFLRHEPEEEEDEEEGDGKEKEDDDEADEDDGYSE